MRKENGSLVWIIFPGRSGNGTNYEDDGTTTQYRNTASKSISWTALAHQTNGKVHTVNITGQPVGTPRQQVLQLRKLVGARAPPATVECNGKVLPRIAPPSTEGALGSPASNATSGWWVVQSSEDSLWYAGGSLMISLPVGIADMSTTVSYASALGK
jgi:hypothetical protein